MERKKINGVTVSFQDSTLKNPGTILSQRLQLNSILCSEDKSKFLIHALRRDQVCRICTYGEVKEDVRLPRILDIAAPIIRSREEDSL